MKYSIINANKSDIRRDPEGLILSGMDITCKELPILIIGEGKLASSVTVCLLLAGHPVTLVTDNKNDAIESVYSHFLDLSRFNDRELNLDLLEVANSPDCKAAGYKIGIAITSENLFEKRAVLQQLEKNIPPGSVIAINTESIPLSTLQEACDHPDRLIGLNWVEPAHTTFFLELIINGTTDNTLADNLYALAKNHWNKDPYLISNDVSIRAKMLSGMIREAFYLVQNGYASIEDIDRDQ